MLSSNTSAVSGDTTYVEDVFSTYLYTGNASTQTINNGIDLSTKGGMVWAKARSASYVSLVEDTVRGAGKGLNTSSTAAETSAVGTGLTAFNTNGFSLTGDFNSGAGPGSDNYNNTTYVSWTFRKQPKFFDVVTYTGTGVARTVAHNLGSVPGCIIVKRTSASGNDWAVYHRSTGNTKRMNLNYTDTGNVSAGNWNNTDPTSTDFTVGNSLDVNGSGSTYVAYLFAHDAGGFGLAGTDNVISCGSFTTDGSGNATVSLGYEPQWVMVKRTDSSTNGDWLLLDTMRGWSNTGNVYAGQSSWLYANSSAAEDSAAGNTRGCPTATGFTYHLNASATYIYIAIRRGPMKVPTDGTTVFSPVTFSFDSFTTAGFPVDFLLSKQYGGVNDWRALDRLRGSPPPSLNTNTTSAESSEGYWKLDNSTGVNNVAGGGIPGYENWMLRRAPSFFDEVCYTGTGSAQTQTHNLGVAPELMIMKVRNTTGGWGVYTATYGPTGHLVLNTTAASTTTGSTLWNSTAPTASVFSVGTAALTNTSGNLYVAYLFATCAGVSKVGSYTGNGSSQTINCGFAAGARFVMIKRTDSTGDWYVWDSARGIVSGNDPHLSLNSGNAEVTTDDTIDTDSSGFVVNHVAATGVNVNGGTYIYLAIA